MTAEEWLEKHAISCVRWRGRWSQQACADLIHRTPDLCAGCYKRPKDPKPSAAGKNLVHRLLASGFICFGGNVKARGPDASLTNPYPDP